MLAERKRDSIREFDSIITSVARDSGLPNPVACGSDGDGVTWIWRKYLGEGEATRVTELRVHVWPGALEEEFQSEVIATAWMKNRRRAAWTRTYATPGVEDSLKSEDS